MNGLWVIPIAGFLTGLGLLAWVMSPVKEPEEARKPMESQLIKQALDVMLESPTVLAMGRLPDGEMLRFWALGPGVEVQIETPGGKVTHRCFYSVYAFMLWYVSNYIETGSM